MRSCAFGGSCVVAPNKCDLFDAGAGDGPPLTPARRRDDAAEKLRDAVRALGRIAGRVSADDILDAGFASAGEYVSRETPMSGIGSPVEPPTRNRHFVVMTADYTISCVWHFARFVRMVDSA